MTPAPGERVRSLDLYRGAAVMLMIAAHVCDAFLSEAARAGPLWTAMNVLFGFVGPAFLVVSGAAIAIADDSQHSLRSARAARRRRRVRRLGLLLALGYWVQIPVLSLRQLAWNRRPEELARLFDSNILHVIAIGGTAIVAIDAFVRSPTARRAMVFVVALAIVIATPWLWHCDCAGALWLPVRAFVSPQPASTFPLAPFVAYMLAGMVIAPLVRSARAGRVGAIGAAALALASLLDLAIGAVAPHDDFWYGSIQHTLMRFAGVVIGLAASMLATRERTRLTILERIGRASLAIYVIHLILVYGSPMTMGMRWWFDGALNRTQPAPIVALLYVIVATVAVGAVFAWPALRNRYPSTARVMVVAWWCAFAALFLLTP